MDFIQIFFAALLSIPSGLFLDRCIKHFQEKKDKEQVIVKLKNDRKQLATALKNAINDNIDHIKKLDKRIDCVFNLIQIGQLFELMDLTLLDATVEKKYELLDSIEICLSIDKARYILCGINDTLNHIIVLSAQPENKNAVTNIYSQLLTLIKMGWITGPLQDAIEKLNIVIEQNS